MKSGDILLDSIADDNTQFRSWMWLNHNPTHFEYLYGDAGEMQCNHRGCMVDFKRDTADKLIDTMRLVKDCGHVKGSPLLYSDGT